MQRRNFGQSTQPFYLEDLIIRNVDTGETVKQMFGRDGNVSWELTGLSWELNITGIVTPSSKSMVTPAATSPSTIPRMPTTSSSRSPAASTPKKNKSKKGRKLLKKIIPLPQETTDDDQETTNDEGPRLQTHEYETFGETPFQR